MPEETGIFGILCRYHPREFAPIPVQFPSPNRVHSNSNEALAGMNFRKSSKRTRRPFLFPCSLGRTRRILNDLNLCARARRGGSLRARSKSVYSNVFLLDNRKICGVAFTVTQLERESAGNFLGWPCVYSSACWVGWLGLGVILIPAFPIVISIQPAARGLVVSLFARERSFTAILGIREIQITSKVRRRLAARW